MSTRGSTHYLIIWPDERWVPERTVRQWAQAAIANEKINGPESRGTLDLLVQLHVAGLVTWTGRTEEMQEGSEA